MTQVLVRGEGVAARCCARLLQDAGVRTHVEGGIRRAQPAIMLGQPAQKIFSDIFQRQDLFDGFLSINRRIVQWGHVAEPTVIPHSAVVASERVLLDRMGPPQANAETEGPVDWTVLATRPLPEGAKEHSFGARVATATSVHLKATAEANTCWIESLPNGWLFLLPENVERAWMLSVGDTVDNSLAASRLIAARISGLRGDSAHFPSHPRIADPLCGADWLACGTAALGFDPLCGDGAGHAAREAILAAAVIRAAADGEDPKALSTHYRSRLISGFGAHLAACEKFYQGGHSGDWWEREIRSTREGMAWSSTQLRELGPPTFRLDGFDLKRID